MRKRQFLGAAIAGALLPACGGGGGGDGGLPIGSDTLLQRLQADGGFTTLLRAIDRGGLGGTLGDGGQSLTLFAAGDAAYDRLAQSIGFADGAALVDGLSVENCQDIVNYQLVPQRLSLANLTPSASNPDPRFVTRYRLRFNNDPTELIFVVENGELRVWGGAGRNDITLPRTDLTALNGVLHVTSDVVLPRGVLSVAQALRASADSTARFADPLPPGSALFNELQGSGPFTVFVVPDTQLSGPLTAPQVRHHVVARTPALLSSAFADGTVLTPLTGPQLTLRVQNGRNSIFQGGAEVAVITDVDFYTRNGVIHVLDGPLPA